MNPTQANMNDPSAPAAPAGKWTTGLFGCCEDPGSCVKTSCCPCITLGQNAVILDRNDSSVACPGAAGLVLYARSRESSRTGT
ncbi:unnamed protein product [Linum tenue]|uniref:Uncharacterized protein n=1 Tax=Linum tenue TaxID=586396 RepID=A0AAV0ITY5_9ROSI|nr:unnamed protein product [Linum tenue]